MVMGNEELDEAQLQRLEEEYIAKTMEQRPLVVGLEQAWLLNSRVRDLLEQCDLPAGIPQGGNIGPILVNPKALALEIIRALRSLQTVSETSIMVCEAECWYLERRFRCNDREPEARALLLKIHELILGFHPELIITLESADAAIDVDRSYKEALRILKSIEDANKDAGENPPADAGTVESTGDGPILSE